MEQDTLNIRASLREVTEEGMRVRVECADHTPRPSSIILNYQTFGTVVLNPTHPRVVKDSPGSVWTDVFLTGKGCAVFTAHAEGRTSAFAAINVYQ